MKAHNIAPKGALVGGGNPAGGSAGATSSPPAPKKRATKKRKVQAESDSDDEAPNVKQEVKKEVKSEKKPKAEAEHPDDGSCMLSDIPEAPSSLIKKEISCGDGVVVGAGTDDYGALDVCHAYAMEQAVKQDPALKHEYGSEHQHTPSPHPHPCLDNGGASSHTMSPAAKLQSFGYETNSDFQSLIQAQMPSPARTLEPPTGVSGVYPSGAAGAWIQTGPRHYYWDDNARI